MPEVLASVKMDEFGCIRIPQSTRNRMGWGKDTALDLVASEADSNHLTLRRAGPYCALCSKTDVPLRGFKDTHVCESCRQQL